MALFTYSLEIDQGADFTEQFVWSTGAPASAVNLTGCTATLAIRQLPTDGSAVVSISTTPNAQGSIVLGGVAGTILVNITRVATALLAAGPLGSAAAVEGLWLQWQLFLAFPANVSFPAGQVVPFADGPVWVRAQVDR